MGALLGLAMVSAAGLAAVAWFARARRRARRAVASELRPELDWQATHRSKVEAVVEQLKRRDARTPVSLNKGGVSHQVPKRGNPKYSDEKIDIRALNEILAIDPVARTCTAEPGASFVDVVAATLRHGLAPIVVPELMTITLGGAVAGCSIESMSFRHGGFHDTCLEYEVITASGQVLRCTPENEHRLVFEMMHSSFGTLGVLSQVVFRLVPAKPFVKLVHEKHPTLAEYRASVERHRAAEDADFLDGITHAPDCWVLCVGTFVDQAPYTHAYDWMRVFWLTTRTRELDYLRTPDYFFRYDRGVTNVHPKSWLGRLVLGKLFGSSQLLLLGERLHRFLEDEAPVVTVDVFLPFSKAAQFVEWFQDEFGFHPLWTVPYKRTDYGWIADGYLDGIDDDLFLDLAVYGMDQPKGKNVYRMIERKLVELQGLKTLISHNYYEVEEFWGIWNQRNYQAVKALTDPNNLFRDLYAKTCLRAKATKTLPP